MKSECQNIYKLCRLPAWLNQDVAAERLEISPRSLSDYETGKTIPGDDVVCRMIELYGAPELAYLHLKENTEVGRRYLPAICLDELPRAVLRLQKESRDMQAIEGDLISIACDGVVDNNEQSLWGKARTELQELAGAALAVLFTRKEEKPLVRAAR
ncbi:MAG: helix-turn-helix domain-containing protein [Syntrophomonadaceae bacterium]|nr:helix-turn-helix domain-containing protein [Syntrophomonadaceae bacterium]